MTAGIRLPFCSLVRSLKALTKSIMGTPAWPRAGPTGGAGVAAAAGMVSLMIVFIFLAIVFEERF